MRRNSSATVAVIWPRRADGLLGRIVGKNGGSKMYCVKQLQEDLYWVGGNDRRLALFESAYPIPQGVSYLSLIHI